jgi:formamidopyrimidine-DNA glycosylase
MSGHWVRQPPDQEPPPFARLGLVFDALTMWYADARRFGCVVPVAASELAEQIRGDCGPDALDEPLDAEALQARVTSRKPVKVALMEQDRLAGLGNIHTIEALFRAKIAPKLRADALTQEQWATLAGAIVEQLQSSIAAEDTDDDLVYVNLGGPNPFAIYDRDNEPCPVCGAPIVAEELGGRTTYWCPTCQPLEPA